MPFSTRDLLAAHRAGIDDIAHGTSPSVVLALSILSPRRPPLKQGKRTRGPQLAIDTPFRYSCSV
ncbi:MAG: hypothetical protein MZV64_63190 [Ignavibacteriales bacterium]|nr:hypothetical protein [Ignavibacteriales bacterium]